MSEAEIRDQYGTCVDVLDTAHHRNGVAGQPFRVALVTDVSGAATSPGSRKVVVMFGESGYTAVLDVDLLAQGVITFGENSWRGDHYDGLLRPHLFEDEEQS